jgi:hypothetical protein
MGIEPMPRRSVQSASTSRSRQWARHRQLIGRRHSRILESVLTAMDTTKVTGTAA